MQAPSPTREGTGATATDAAPGTALGHGVAGPGFYVWDESRREAEHWADALRQVVHPDADATRATRPATR